MTCEIKNKIPFTENAYQPHKMYDKCGKETGDIDYAYSLVTFEPHKFTFYTKRVSKFWKFFGKNVVCWDFHHTSNTFGSWMWPDGLPLRFDGICNIKRSIDHANKLGSSWRPSIDR
ncbi:hypothetical protein VP14_234 [Vibrio phage VPMCC14]|nr:hypothetical protein VP14_234 [Vibrio phage VPMCC14]